MIEKRKIGCHSPDEYWQNWTKQKLGNDLFITDIDNCIRSRCGNFAIIELKRYGGAMATSQKITYNLLDRILRDASGRTYPININGFSTNTRINYKGFFLIQFEKTSFEDGKVFLNGKESNEKEIIQILSFL